jgi:hypothetical protein
MRIFTAHGERVPNFNCAVPAYSREVQLIIMMMKMVFKVQKGPFFSHIKSAELE